MASRGQQPADTFDMPESRSRQRLEALVRRSKAAEPVSTKQALMTAATQVVGEEGFDKASIAKITSAAGVAQGTFYTYFPSRQALFDTLLPSINDELRQFVRARLSATQSLVEVEVGTYLAFTEFVNSHPGYGRILFESDTMAAAGARINVERTLQQHIARLRRHWERGELPAYELDELPALSTLLMDFRRHFVRVSMESYPFPLSSKTLVDVTVRLIRRALAPDPAPGASNAGRTR